eukprot:jgi/Astpho2/5644/fgenesh1_pg.00079_%23_78_t
MYIPELDALVFLSEFLDGRPEQPILQEGITALYATAGAFPTWLSGGCVTAAQVPNARAGDAACCQKFCREGDGDVAELFEALGAGRGVPVLAFGLLLVFVCKATFRQRLHLAFWLLDRDEDGFVNKTDVNRAVGPLMSAAQAGLVLMGTLSDEQSPWDSFKDSVRELATDKVAAAIAAGAFDEADEGQHNRLNAQQFRLMVECIAADVATLLVDMTDLQGQVEHLHSQLAPPGAGEAGVPAALRRLVRKYAGEEATEQLLGPPPLARSRPSLRGADGPELRLQRSSSGAPPRPRPSAGAGQTPRSAPPPLSTGGAPPGPSTPFATQANGHTAGQPPRQMDAEDRYASGVTRQGWFEGTTRDFGGTPRELPVASEVMSRARSRPPPQRELPNVASEVMSRASPRAPPQRSGSEQNILCSADKADLERRASHPQARASRPGTCGHPPQSANGLSEGLGAQVQFAEERIQREVEEHARRVRAAEKAAAAAEEALKEEMYALEEDHSFDRIDPRRALVALIVGLGARWYLMQFVKLMVVLCVLLGDAALVVGLYRGQHLSLELSLGIAFFVDLILMAAALAFIASGVNTDIFTWGKEAYASLKSDDNEKGKESSGNTVAKLAAMESAVPEQYRPIFRSVVGKLTQAEEKMRGKKKQGSREGSRQGSADMSKHPPSGSSQHIEETGHWRAA